MLPTFQLSDYAPNLPLAALTVESTQHIADFDKHLSAYKRREYDSQVRKLIDGLKRLSDAINEFGITRGNKDDLLRDLKAQHRDAVAADRRLLKLLREGWRLRSGSSSKARKAKISSTMDDIRWLLENNKAIIVAQKQAVRCVKNAVVRPEGIEEKTSTVLDYETDNGLRQTVQTPNTPTMNMKSYRQRLDERAALGMAGALVVGLPLLFIVGPVAGLLGSSAGGAIGLAAYPWLAARA